MNSIEHFHVRIIGEMKKGEQIDVIAVKVASRYSSNYLLKHEAHIYEIIGEHSKCNFVQNRRNY